MGSSCWITSIKSCIDEVAALCGITICKICRSAMIHAKVIHEGVVDRICTHKVKHQLSSQFITNGQCGLDPSVQQI